jgi:hypothetical protein
MDASNSPDATLVKRSGDQLMRWRNPAIVLIGVPLVSLALAYAALAAAHGRLWLWDVRVHENGVHTLGRTIFYPSHFLREVPTDIAMALFLVAALRRAGLLPAARGRTWSGWAPGLAAALLAAALAATAARSGWASALLDLGQFRTRDDLSAYGSHWRFHWLSTLWFASASVVIARVASAAVGGDARCGHDVGGHSWAVAWVWFAGLTVVFGLSPEIVTDPRFVGHQAREILTHGPITCLLVVGSAVLMAGRFSPGGPPTRAMPAAAGWLAPAVFVLVPTGLAALAIAGGAMATAQTANGMSAVVAAHVFEHVLDYLFVWLIVFGIGGWRRQ